jgi:hypothetical protein
LTESVIPSSASRILKLNALAFSDSNSLYLSLSTSVIPGKFRALVDSGSSDCFVDTHFVHQKSLPVVPIDPIPLTLFDGTINSYITECVELPIHFTTGEVQLLKFFVTRLDDSCSVVLGHDWLFRYNPLIDWKLKLVTFPDTRQEDSNFSTSNLPDPPEDPPEDPESLDSIDDDPDSNESLPTPEPEPVPATLDPLDPPEIPGTPVSVATTRTQVRLESDLSGRLFEVESMT